MAHQGDSNVIEGVLQVLVEQGFGQIGEAVRILLNEAMRLERSQVLEAQPYERSEKRRGYANGFKPKTEHPFGAAHRADSTGARR